MRNKDQPKLTNFLKIQRRRSAFFKPSKEIKLAINVAPQLKPLQIWLKNLGFGLTAIGNNAATIIKNTIGFSHSPGLRAANRKSRLTVASTKLMRLPPQNLNVVRVQYALAYRYFLTHDDW